MGQIKIQERVKQEFATCNTLYHQQVSTLLIHYLGYNMPISDCKSGVVIDGVLSGDNGYLEIDENHNVEHIIPSKK